MTQAQMKFLSGFLHGSVFRPEAKSYWGEVLHELPESAINKFVVAGLLVAAPLAAKLDGEFKATDIKGFLRERGLPVSGRKSDGIERLMVADPKGMEAKVAGVAAYICTTAGREIAEQFTAEEERRSRIARERSRQLLEAGDVRGALASVAEFEKQQVFQRGVGVDWNGMPSSEDVDLVQAILAARPKILKGVPDEEWKTIQLAAAMQQIWGERSAKPWIPENMIGSINLDPDTTVRMVVFAGQTQARVKQYRRFGCSSVKVSGCGSSSCPACRNCPAPSALAKWAAVAWFSRFSTEKGIVAVHGRAKHLQATS